MTPPDDKPGAREFWIELGADLGTGMGRVRDLVHFKEIKQSTEPYSNTIHHVIEYSAYEAVTKERDQWKANFETESNSHGESIAERDQLEKELAASIELQETYFQESRRLIGERDRLTKENEALRAEIKTYSNKNLVLTNNLDQCYRSRSKIYYDEISTRGQHDKLAADNAAMREALEKIAIDDDVNKNFNRSEDENQYYINLAREVLSAIGEVGEK